MNFKNCFTSLLVGTVLCLSGANASAAEPGEDALDRTPYDYTKYQARKAQLFDRLLQGRGGRGIAEISPEQRSGTMQRTQKARKAYLDSTNEALRRNYEAVNRAETNEETARRDEESARNNAWHLQAEANRTIAALQERLRLQETQINALRRELAETKARLTGTEHELLQRETMF